MSLLKNQDTNPALERRWLLMSLGDENTQTFKNKKSGPREHESVGESRMILATWPPATAEKEVNTDGGESRVLCWKPSKQRKPGAFFQFFSVKNSTNLSAKSWGGSTDERISAGTPHNTSPRTSHNFRGPQWLSRIPTPRNPDLACMQILLHWWTPRMQWDPSKADPLRRQISSNKRLVSFATITVSLIHPGKHPAPACLACGGACPPTRADKASRHQAAQKWGDPPLISPTNLMVFMKGDSSTSLGHGGWEILGKNQPENGWKRHQWYGHWKYCHCWTWPKPGQSSP